MRNEEVVYEVDLSSLDLEKIEEVIRSLENETKANREKRLKSSKSKNVNRQSRPEGR